MCPGGHLPSGHITGNAFFLCKPDRACILVPFVCAFRGHLSNMCLRHTGPGNITPAIFVNPALPTCADDLVIKDNTIDGSAPLVEMPQVSFNPPAPTTNATSGQLPVLGV